MDCLYGNEKRVKKLFLALPSALYKREELRQDRRCEKQILEGKHVLSVDFRAIPFVVVSERGEALCRCLLALYPEDETAYLGFFESIDCADACAVMFVKAAELARAQGKTRIAGPVDASIWLGYRFKVNHFGQAYTGEPYNKDYYARLWQACGYAVCDRYFSNGFRKIHADDVRERFAKRLEWFKQRGYVFKTLCDVPFETALKEIYDLMIALYADFPCYRHISYGQFRELFGALRFIVRSEMVKLVYENNGLAAFFVCVPNYKNLTSGALSLRKLLRILRVRRKPEEYVLLYMGVRPDCLGLGSALSELVKNDLCQNQCTSIGALIHEGKITEAYYRELAVRRYEYVLLETHIM